VRGHGQQLAAYRTDGRVELPRIHQRLDEIGQQQHVRIERQNPLATGLPDSLVLGGGESHVLVVVVNAAAILELLQDIGGAIARGVVHHDDFLERVLLRQHRFEAAFDKAAAVVSDYRDRDEAVVRHEREPEDPYTPCVRYKLAEAEDTSSRQPDHTHRPASPTIFL